MGNVDSAAFPELFDSTETIKELFSNMTDSDSQLRNEIKFLCHYTDYSYFTNWLSRNPMVFVQTYSPRWINSLYFDSSNLNTYQANIDGVSTRHKLRFRTYGKSIGFHLGFLELKCRSNRLGWKLRHHIDIPKFSMPIRWETIRAQWKQQIPPEGKLWLDSLSQPIVLIRYYRHYFENLDRNIRITTDHSQTVWSQFHSSVPNLRTAHHSYSSIVVEVKFKPEFLSVAANAIQGIPLRPSRHSKYVNAVKRLHG